MSTWLNDIVENLYREPIQEQLDNDSTLTKVLRKKEPSGDPVYGPTRHDMHKVHANMFLETLQELKDLYMQMGTPISFWGNDDGDVFVSIGTVQEEIY